ncbi:HDOD domain-containing protein [Alteromonas sp. ASW11-19]|uniref:HDOD domain-containing protein n=1 Tax=Alteromonas salexigens TaxID=2982530 RepID=A0ABT2VQH7_9ALTE|nr:HDOD domain-containing protein [Alteromonas salexigens]MCU7555559.1 HDOD domain-containing protein [Alteromonas salexigens]
MSLTKHVSQATHSFTFPDICLRIRDVLDDPRSGADDIASMISVDPSLTAKVLRLANSALFRFPAEIESITKAVNVIGGEALYNLVVAETANTAFRHFDSAKIDLDKHWFESVYCGMAAKYLAKSARLRGSERFFVMGILQNFGELVVAKNSPDAYQTYSDDERELAPEIRQLDHFGFTFNTCSGTIMESWKLPMPLYYPVLQVHRQEKIRSETDIGILACARRLTLRENQQERYAEIDVFSADIANSVKVEGETLGNTVEFANKEANKVAALIR